MKLFHNNNKQNHRTLNTTQDSMHLFSQQMSQTVGVFIKNTLEVICIILGPAQKYVIFHAPTCLITMDSSNSHFDAGNVLADNFARS